MARVGILSMQRIINYGSFLQAYALKKIIEELGHKVEFVDYHIEQPLIIDNLENKNKIIRKSEKGMEIFKYKVPLQHKLKFIEHKQFFSNKYFSILGISKNMNYNPHVDCLVIGSDEVFNCIQKNSNVGYSLELFGKCNNAKKLISYAGSFGNTTLEKIDKFDKRKEIASLLEQFNIISVRDKNSAKIIFELVGKEPEYHLDPVLLYDYIEKCKLIPKINSKEKYIILYAYSGRITDKEADWISNYAKNNKMKVYAIGGIQKCADKFLNCSPFEVLSYFKNAEQVITDTFHGSIFSIITHRKFVTIVRKSIDNEYGNEEKLTDLLSCLKLESRIVNNIDQISNILNKNIDYSMIDIIIQKQRMKTIKYLKNSI